MTAVNIANFIVQNAFEADRVVMLDMCDQLDCETEPKKFAVTTRESMEELWHEEEMEVMRAKIRML